MSHPLPSLSRGLVLLACLVSFTFALTMLGDARAEPATSLPKTPDQELKSILANAGFTGSVESTLTTRLGRALDPKLANVGRLLWFDTITGLNDDNTCGGCHSPTNGFGDTQSIAIGIENNGIVGPHRTGPRNMRRSPMVINTAFYPNLMWNSRFLALSNDPFDPGAGFQFPEPENRSLSYLPNLLTAQAFIPPTEVTEVVGYTFSGTHDAIRQQVLDRLNNIPAYRKLFGKAYPQVARGEPINFEMFAGAIAEFEFMLTFANAPLDRFARGDTGALTTREKKGAILFFGDAGCIACHQVSGASNEMFSDFQAHAAGTPQIVPRVTNNFFDGPNANQDFGKFQVSKNPNDFYKFRTSPLRNVAVQAAFMHNGAFTRLQDAIRYHLNALEYANQYSPKSAGLDADLTGPMGPLKPVLRQLDPLLVSPPRLTEKQFRQLVAFVRDGLLDPRAKPENLQRLVPQTVPSGRTTLTFEFP